MKKKKKQQKNKKTGGGEDIAEKLQEENTKRVSLRLGKDGVGKIVGSGG